MLVKKWNLLTLDTLLLVFPCLFLSVFCWFPIFWCQVEIKFQKTQKDRDKKIISLSISFFQKLPSTAHINSYQSKNNSRQMSDNNKLLMTHSHELKTRSNFLHITSDILSYSALLSAIKIIDTPALKEVVTGEIAVKIII